MINQHLNTLELIALQNQLLLSIGASLNARECAHKFIQSTYRSLGLKSIHLYIFEESSSGQRSLENYFSLPDNKLKEQQQPVIDNIRELFETDNNKTHITKAQEHNEVLAFRYGTSGILLLEKQHGKFQESVKDVLVPVIIKLSEYFLLCEQQKSLNEEVKVNKEAQRNYELQAKRDPLTNLPNRREFRYSLSKEISNSQRYGYYGALMYIDLDNFKNVNDSLGHSIGDILLTQVANRLSSQTRSGDAVFRIGGDEFVYILCNIGETETDAIHTSQTVATRVIETLALPIEIGEFSLHVTPSIGIAIFPDDYEESNDSENVLKHADTAMYRAKRVAETAMRSSIPRCMSKPASA